MDYYDFIIITEYKDIHEFIYYARVTLLTTSAVSLH